MNRMPATEELLRDHGLRVTPQRMAILDFIRNCRDHPTADEVYHAVRQAHPAISLNTIYKSLEAFETSGLVTRFVIGDRGKYRYDFNTETHIHHLCSECGRVADVPIEDAERLENFVDSIARDQDGSVEKAEISLIGKCRECLARRD
ncbi:MAG: Fur family transcriptional regulator [Bacillota bacterium]